jgi:hypothetical protein
MQRRAVGMLAGVLLAAGMQSHVFAQDAGAGMWEGPWYRGMTSGKVKIDLRSKPGNIQFTNLDNFGTDARPVDAVLEDGALKLKCQGDKGGPLTASLKLNEAGTEAKGLGKFEGFPLRFEIKRTE